jgi:preprotein translocase subunit SecD
VNRRLSHMGYRTKVRVQGSQVVVDLPNASAEEVEQVSEVLRKPGRLEMVLLRDEQTAALRAHPETLPAGVTAGNDEDSANYLEGKSAPDVEHAASARAPPDTRVALARAPNGSYRAVLLDAAPAVTGEDVESARADVVDHQPIVLLAFNSAGEHRFSEATAAWVNRRMAIVYDGTVLSTPRVRSRIRGGRAQITLGYSRPFSEQMALAKAMAASLEGGELPQLTFVSATRYEPGQ